MELTEVEIELFLKDGVTLEDAVRTARETRLFTRLRADYPCGKCLKRLGENNYGFTWDIHTILLKPHLQEEEGIELTRTLPPPRRGGDYHFVLVNLGFTCILLLKKRMRRMGNVVTGKFPSKRSLKAAQYARDIKATRDLPYEQKFAEYLELCNNAANSGECDVILVAFPEVLGDNYEELMLNLSHAAHADLLVSIAKTSPAAKP